MEPSLRIIISGYYGFRNAGDEAMLAGIIAGLRRAASAAEAQPPAPLEVTVLSGDPPATAQAHGVRAIPRLDMRALRAEMRSADLLISGGGNLFQDATSARSCLYYLYVLRQALRADVPVVVLGQGIGPLRRWWLRKLVAHALNRVHGIAVRDSESSRELERLGVTRPPVRLGVDPSLALDPPDREQVAAAWRAVGVDDPSSVLAVAPRTWRVTGAGEGLIASLAVAIKRATAQLGDVAQPPPAVSSPLQRGRIGQAGAPVPHLTAARPRVVVFPMQRPQDDEACEALAQVVGGVLAQPELTPVMLAAMIGSARVVVAMRLHALIFAAMGGAMPVAVSYDPKVEAFMNDIGLRTAAALANLDETRLVSAIIEAWNAADETRASLRALMAERRQVALDLCAWAASLARKR